MEEMRVIESRSIHHFPDDIWPEILCRLPVKSLIRFRCVSKWWKSMIEDPNFCRSHLNSFENNCHGTHLFVAEQKHYFDKERYIVRSSDTFEPTAELSSLETAKLVKDWCVVCSMDGLVMLRYYTPKHELLLWNPSIKRARKLPPSPVVSEEIKNFDLGFGFSSLVNDYKLVRLVRNANRSLHSVAIYTVGTGLWKTIEFHSKRISDWCWFYMRAWRTVCFRGILYFTAFHMDNEKKELGSFDLSNEVFASAEAPRDVDICSRELHLRVVTLVHGGSSLGLVYFSPYEGSIWVSDSNATDIDLMNWTKCYKFTSCFPEFDGLELPKFLYLKKNGDALLQQFVSKRVSSYNFEANEDKALLETSQCVKMVCGYIESLVMLNG